MNQQAKKPGRHMTFRVFGKQAVDFYLEAPWKAASTTSQFTTFHQAPT